MKKNIVLLACMIICLFGCATPSMNTRNICIDCDAQVALSENDKPDQVSKKHACWFDRYDSSKDREGKYCIYWDENKKIFQYGFESYNEDDAALLFLMY